MNFKLIWAMILVLIIYIGYLMQKEVVVPVLEIENPIIADISTSTEEVIQIDTTATTTSTSTPN